MHVCFCRRPECLAHDAATTGKLRTFVQGTADSYNFPNLPDLQALRAKRPPAGMKFYHLVECSDDAPPDGLRQTECRKVKGRPRSHSRRSVAPNDLTDFQQNLAAYNRIIEAGGPNYRNGSGVGELDATSAERYLKFIQEIAGSDWPNDFLVLEGGQVGDGCGSADGPEGLYGWLFSLFPRDVAFDAMLVTNVSQRPLNSGCVARRSVAPRGLRELTTPARIGNPGPLAHGPQTLAAGETILVPTRIVLPPSRALRSVFSSPRASDQAFKRLGTSEFRIERSSYGAPTFRD